MKFCARWLPHPCWDRWLSALRPRRSRFFCERSLDHPMAIAEIDPTLPADWSEGQFLVVGVRCSTATLRLGLVSEEGKRLKRIHPSPGCGPGCDPDALLP